MSGTASITNKNMAPVSDTKTLVDAQKEHKDMREKITGLTVEIEHAERKRNAILHETEDMRNEQKRIGQEMEEDRKHTFRILMEAKEVIAESFRLLKYADTIVENTMNFIKELQGKMAAAMADLKKAKDEKEQIHKEIAGEYEKLAIHRHDLEIYEKRLEARIAEAGLQNEIQIIP